MRRCVGPTRANFYGRASSAHFNRTLSRDSSAFSVRAAKDGVIPLAGRAGTVGNKQLAEVLFRKRSRHLSHFGDFLLDILAETGGFLFAS